VQHRLDRRLPARARPGLLDAHDRPVPRSRLQADARVRCDRAGRPGLGQVVRPLCR
jgi:hypothetical protein